MLRSGPLAIRATAARPACIAAPARLALLAALAAPAAAWAAPHASSPAAPRGVSAALLLDGRRTAVRWTDGDSFHVDSGPLRGRSVRLADVNALESYGPVHRIGTLSPAALLELAQGSAAVAAAGLWSCASLAHRDVYGRELARCPQAAAALVQAGHAMVFAVEGRADDGLLALQREAQAAGRGLWAGGVPPRVISSLHSRGERGADRRGAYDRHVDTATGAARKVRHRRTYQACQEVCLDDGPLPSCMTYVPFQRRYRDRPPCPETPEARLPAGLPPTPPPGPAAGPPG